MLFLTILLTLPILSTLAGVILPRQQDAGTEESILQGGKTYILTNAKSDTVLDLCGTCDNGTVIGWPRHGRENQQWKLDWAGSGWTFQSMQNNGYLSYAGGTAEDGAPIIVVDESESSEPTIWHIWADQDDPSTYRVFIPYTYQVLDLWNKGDPTPGTPVTLWWTWRNTHQAWYFEAIA